jgi:predicted MFS family arabinose efflux permease
VFLGLGLFGLAGTWAISRALRRWLFMLLIAIPAVMAGLAALMIALPDQTSAIVALILLWGFFGTAAPVGWGTWLARSLGDEAEAGGGLQVAVIQLAIMAGAAGGGLIFDAKGWHATFTLAALLLLASALMAGLAALDDRRTK